MPHCAVIWCNNQSKNVNKKKNGVSYHKFPYDPIIKDKWIRATGKCNWFPQNHDTVCSEHFEKDCFTEKASKTYLFFDAIPTLKLHPIFDEIDSLTNTINSDNTDGATSPKRRKKKNNRLTTTKRKKKNNPPELSAKEGGPSDITPENRRSEEGWCSLVTTVNIKEEHSSDTETLIQLAEDRPPDLTTAVQIKREEEEDPVAEIIVGVLPDKPPNVVRAPRKAYYTINPKDSPQVRYLKRSLKVAQETIKRQNLQVKRFRECNRRLTKKVAKLENIIKSLREQSDDTSDSN